MQRKAPGSIPHEKTDYRTAKKIRAILEAQTTSAEQEILHSNDEGTTLFGVIRDDTGLPTFRDYCRPDRFGYHHIKQACVLTPHRRRRKEHYH